MKLSGKVFPRPFVNRWRMNVNRSARIFELALLVATCLGIATLIFIWSELATLLGPGESAALVRARLIRGLFSLAVPLVTLLSVSIMRGRIAALLKAQNATSATLQSAKYLWVIVMIFVVGILCLDFFVIAQGFQDIDFR